MESTPLEYVYEIGMILAALAAGGSAWLGRGHVERRRNGHASPPDDAALGLLSAQLREHMDREERRALEDDRIRETRQREADRLRGEQERRDTRISETLDRLDDGTREIRDVVAEHGRRLDDHAAQIAVIAANGSGRGRV